ncbi:MAG: type II toxin-antitoxin system RelE/ParE family toxin [Lachnospiraceae bacterium]|nr:type II toxin-antitoxin system RelE/ParE family toxin [Lachnospiraceae bacterium]
MGDILQKKYKIKYTYSSRDDIRGMKRYILDNFKYRELGENFTKKIKTAVDGLRAFPTGHNTTGIRYRGYDIYLKPYRTYLLFYIVDDKLSVVTILRVLQDGMNWQYILKRWIYEQDTIGKNS